MVRKTALFCIFCLIFASACGGDDSSPTDTNPSTDSGSNPSSDSLIPVSGNPCKAGYSMKLKPNDDYLVCYPNNPPRGYLCDGVWQFYWDKDGDGAGADGYYPVLYCPNETVPGMVAHGNGDCNDNDPNVRPGIGETCGDGVDNDCNLKVDDGCQ